MYLFSKDPQALLSSIKNAIMQGHIVTWKHSVHSGKDHFTHTTPDKQWENKAWLRAKVEADKLTFEIVRPKEKSVPRAVYAVYHGRFIQTTIDHVFNNFTVARATPNPVEGDDVGPNGMQ